MKGLRTAALAASLTLAAAPAVAGAAPAAGPRPKPAAGVAYAGQTAQDLPMSLVLAADRRTIRRLDIAWIALPAQCSSGLPYASSTRFGGGLTKAVALSSAKRFRHTFVDAVTLPEIVTLEEHPVVRGTVGRSRAYGTFRAIAIVKDAAGVEVNRCDTGTISWSTVQ